MSFLTDALRSIGTDAVDGPQGFVILRARQIVAGRRAGESVDVALGSVDYPRTPPAGVHIHTTWGADKLNVHRSLLGNDWRYWSRRLADWRGVNEPHAIIAYVNRVLSDV